MSIHPPILAKSCRLQFAFATRGLNRTIIGASMGKVSDPGKITLNGARKVPFDGQRIGAKGEKLFSLWSEDRGLASTKADPDYGIDFWCQVLRPAGKKSFEEATGAILAVQVKATEGKTRPRVILDRNDAVNLLRQTHATVLVAVRPSVHAVLFLFIGQTLIDRLNDFLASTAKTHSVRLDEFETDVAEFDRSLMYFTRPGTQHRLRIYKAQRAIGMLCPVPPFHAPAWNRRPGCCGCALARIGLRNRSR